MSNKLLSLPTITLTSPGPIAFYLGKWPVRWYGVLIAIGFLTAYYFAEKLIKRNRLNLDIFNDLIFLILIFSMIFARLYFVILSWDYFQDHLIEIPKIWYGGQSIHGGILGAILATMIFSKVKRISFYKYIDIIAVIAPLGQAIGRWGNFFNNEAFGKPVTNWFMKLYIPYDFRPENYLTYKYFHPTFFYESFLDFMLFVFLYNKYNKWKESEGKTFWTYLLFYGILRFCIEFIRVDSLKVFNGFASAHVASVIIVVISSFFLFKR